MSGPRIALVQLGCAKNLVDAEVFIGHLCREGYILCHDPSDADICLVNTCGFTGEAREESIDAILEMAELKKSGQLRGLVALGCMAQRYGAELSREIPELDGVISFAGYQDLPRLLAEIAAEKAAEKASQPTIRVGEPTLPMGSEAGRLLLGSPHSAYLRVAEGCNHRCTFCAIPSFRGRFRSKRPELLVAEARELADAGVRELNLIAEDTNQYGQDLEPRTSLTRLLDDLETINGIRWLRILYAHPAYFPDSLIDRLAAGGKVVPYLDIPLQHGSASVLRRMRRPTKRQTETLLADLRDRIPALCLRTTFIVGFPGETDEEFGELMAFVRRHRFERMGAFLYSSEEGTAAHEHDHPVDEALARERHHELMSLQQEIAFEQNEAQVGRVLTVLVDGEDEEGLFGRTAHDAPEIDPVVRIEGDPDEIEVGTFREVRIIGRDGYDLVGHDVGSSACHAS